MLIFCCMLFHSPFKRSEVFLWSSVLSPLLLALMTFSLAMNRALVLVLALFLFPLFPDPVLVRLVSFLGHWFYPSSSSNKKKLLCWIRCELGTSPWAQSTFTRGGVRFTDSRKSFILTYNLRAPWHPNVYTWFLQGFWLHTRRSPAGRY